MERSAECNAFTQTLEPILLRIADLVVLEIEDDFAVVAFDGEDLRKDGLEAQILAAGDRELGLEKLPVGIDLDLDEVGRGDDFFDLAKVDPLR